MITIAADATAPVPHPLTVTITCYGPAMLGRMPLRCAGAVSVRVIGVYRWAVEVAKERAREAGWTRREPRDAHDFWLCAECGR